MTAPAMKFAKCCPMCEHKELIALGSKFPELRWKCDRCGAIFVVINQGWIPGE